MASGTQTSDSETEELLEFMDLNDRIQTEESTSKLKGLAEKLNGEIDAILRDIHDHFKQNEISKVKKCLNKLSYLRRLRSNVNDKLGIDDQLD